MAHKIKDFDINGNYVERDATTDEKKFLQDKIDNKFNDIMESFRQLRNIKLAKTDWTSSSDLTMSAEMTEYRKKLRDATEGLDTIEKIEAYTFPTEVLK